MASLTSIDAVSVWLDGEYLDDPAIGLHALTHALHYGTSIFEGIRLYPTPRGPALFRLRDHAQRLHDGCAAYGLALPHDVETTCEIVRAVASASERDAAYVRPLAFFAGETVRLNPARECATSFLVAVLPFEGLVAGGTPALSATVSPVMKTPSAALPATVKAGGHYTNAVRALAEAQRRGFDEAILLNDRGHIAEGSGENLFLVRDGRLVTNDASADVLPGITRASVIALAHELGIPVEVRAMERAELAGCDEAFFTGTAAEVVPIRRIDDRQLDEGPVTRRLRTRYAAVVRGEANAPEPWLTYVRG